MLAQSSDPLLLPDLIYAKTDQGRAEVAQRGARLGARERSVLIMLDGQKQCAALSGLLPMAALAPILGQLEKLGLIRAVTAPAATSTATVALAPAAPAATPAQLAHAKATMIATAETYLGLLAADVVRQVTAAEGREQLQRALAHWHMAMQASKHGRDVAAQHLHLIKASLQAPA